MCNKRNEQECLPMHMNYIPNHFYQKAKEELNETSEIKQIELQKFKDLLSGDKNTNAIDFEVDFLDVFLRYSKYNSSKAYHHMQKFMKFRRNYESLIQTVPDEYLKLNSCTRFASFLPYRSPDGCVIVLFELRKWNPNEIPFEQVKRIPVLSFLQTLRCPITQICGYKIIFDFKDSVKHLKYCTPQNITLLYNIAINSFPSRCKEFHCINKSILLSAIWSLMKHALSEKFRKRVLFHSKPEDLLNYFPRSVMPSQYGGSLKDYHDSELIRKLNKDHKNFPLGGMPNYF